jgi:PmbA protein
MTGQISASDLIKRFSGHVDRAEVYELRSSQLPVRFRAGALESVKAVGTAGRALRVVSEGRLGFSTTTDMTDSAGVFENAMASAQYGDPAPFDFPTQAAPSDVATFDDEIVALTETDMIALGKEVVERIAAYDPEMEINVSVNKGIEDVRIVNTGGLDLEERRTSFSVSLEITKAEEGDILIIYDGIGSRARRNVDALALADRVVEQMRAAETLVSVESKAMPIVFHGQGVFPLLLPLMVGLNGRQVYLGASPLKGKIGEQLFDPRFTLVDDGRLDFASRSASFDDEGVPTTSKFMVEQGVVGGFLYDLKTAAQAGAEPTGNGFKSGMLSSGGFRSPPGATASTLLVSPGEKSLEDILADLDEALLVEQVLGMGQGNVLAGEFSNNVALGYLVRKGEIIGRVKNTMIAGNVYELLKDQLVALSDQAEWVYGMLQAPAIALDGVGVASQG